jgi:predicted nucleotidyltransferase
MVKLKHHFLLDLVFYLWHNTAMEKDNILKFLRDNKEFLAQRYGVISIGLFGSYARDEAKEDSDIDIAVELKSQNKFMNFFHLKYYLQEKLNRSIDLGIESTLKPIAKEHIQRDIIYV